MSLGAPKLLLTICLASGAWACSFGLSTQLATHWLKAHDASNFAIGLNHSIYYLGIALASIVTPWLTAKWGNRCAAAGMALFGVSLGLFPWGGGLVGYASLRLLNGMAAALSLIPLETLVSRAAPEGQRTRHFSIYATAILIGGGLGIGLGLEVYHHCGAAAFLLAGAVPAIVGLVLASALPRTLPGGDGEEGDEAVGWSRNFLSYGTGWCQGFMEGGLLAFLALYLLSLGLSEDQASVQMGVLMAGVIVFQIPVAWLADRCGRLPILLFCYAVVAATLALVPSFDSPWLIGACLFCFGACSGAMYPLGLSLLGDRVSEGGLARAYACYLAMECVGSQVGAAAMGQARDLWGESAMFAAGLAAVGIVLVGWGTLHLARRVL